MFAIAPTDLDWFERMRTGHPGELVNFWTPTPWNVRGLRKDGRLYFMLKAPIRKIGGYGVFHRYAEKTATEAWEAYGLGNGVDSAEDLVMKIQQFAARRSASFVPTANPKIGCIELSNLVLFDDSDFIIPESFGHSFPRQIVKLKYFSEPDNMAAASAMTMPTSSNFALLTGTASRATTSRKDRKGQSAFRQMVIANYGWRCCVTSEGVVELLEAAHIQPYIDTRSNHPQNGVCFRVDMHRLFDEGLIAIRPNCTLAVSPKLAHTSYAELDGSAICLPLDPSHHPSGEALEFHRTKVFR